MFFTGKVLSSRFEALLAYCEVADVKAILQIATEDTSLDSAIATAIASADGLIDSLLKPSGLAVPATVPQNIVDASTHFTAWLMRKHADPPITQGYWFNAGDFINLYQPRYMLSGTFRMMQVVKKKTQVQMQLDKIRPDISKVVADLKRWEDKGIYLPGSGAWAINLQGSVGLYRLDEGTGSVAKDNSPRETPVDGTIVNGHWESNAYVPCKYQALQGDGYVDCGDSITFSTDTQFSVGCLFSPSSLSANPRYLIHKDGQFALSHVGVDGLLRFTFTDASSNIQTFDSEPGVVRVGGRHFAVISYDGENVKMYMNGHLHKSFAQTDAPHTSTNKVYLGVSFQGVLAHCMLWSRRLVDQEVLELYFFPLNRVVQSRRNE